MNKRNAAKIHRVMAHSWMKKGPVNISNPRRYFNTLVKKEAKVKLTNL
jgi:hypothetical protein